MDKQKFINKDLMFGPPRVENYTPACHSRIEQQKKSQRKENTIEREKVGSSNKKSIGLEHLVNLNNVQLLVGSKSNAQTPKSGTSPSRKKQSVAEASSSSKLNSNQLHTGCVHVNLQNCNVFINNYQKSHEEKSLENQKQEEKIVKINIEVKVPPKSIESKNEGPKTPFKEKGTFDKSI